MSLVRNLAIATVTTATVAGGAVAYIHFNGLPWATSDAAAVASADVIPDDATLALSLSTDPQAWGKLSEFGNPALQSQVEEGLQSWEKEVSAESGISLEKDILPIVSNLTIALLPPTEVESAGRPEFLVVAGIKNPTKALSLLGKIQQGDNEIKTFQHQGVQISEFVQGTQPESDGPAPESLFSALVDQQLVIAPTRRPVEMAIEAAKGEPSLADVPGAKAALKADLGMNAMLARVYVPSYSALVTDLIAASSEIPPVSPQVLEQLSEVGSVQVGFGVKANGLHVKALTEVGSGLRPANTQPSSGQAPSQFPINTIALVQSRDINQYWDQVTQQLESLPEGEMALGLMRGAAQDINIDLDTEVFDWMTGEFAFGLMPVNDQSITGSLGLASALVMDSGDRPTTEATLKKLDQLAGSYLELKQSKAGNVELTEWVAPVNPPEPVVGHGWLDQDSLLVATGKPALNALTQPSPETLADNPLYQEVMAQLPDQAAGYGFVNMQEALSKIQSLPIPADVADPEALQVMQLIRGIGMVSGWQKDTSVVEVHIALQRRDEAQNAASR